MVKDRVGKIKDRGGELRTVEKGQGPWRRASDHKGGLKTLEKG